MHKICIFYLCQQNTRLASPNCVLLICKAICTRECKWVLLLVQWSATSSLFGWEEPFVASLPLNYWTRIIYGINDMKPNIGCHDSFYNLSFVFPILLLASVNTWNSNRRPPKLSGERKKFSNGLTILMMLHS
jgi:hypothetical protein